MNNNLIEIKQEKGSFINIKTKKECNICHYAHVPEGLSSLRCTVTGQLVEDEHTCNTFKVCDAIFSDTFFNIAKVEVDGN